MMYPANANRYGPDFTSLTEGTILTPKYPLSAGVVLGQRNGLSDLDKLTIQKRYNGTILY